MKRLAFLFVGVFIFSFCVVSQNVGLTENVVVPPKFDASGISDTEENNFASYFNEEMQNYDALDEGLVIMKFTVHPNGDVSDCIAEHSTSKYNTAAVRNILESSTGRWQAGSVNGQPVDMEKEITVKFVQPEHVSLEGLVRRYMSVGIKKYYKADNLEGNTQFSKEKADRKKNRKLKGSIRNLDMAYEYAPREVSVLFWQSKVYEAMGDDVKFNDKFNEYQMNINPSYESMNENVVFELRN